MRHIRAVANKFFFITAAVAFCLFACGKKAVTPVEYVNWVEDNGNGLSVKKEFDDISYHVLYKPVNYIAAKELVNKGISMNEIPQRIKDLGDMQYVTLRITSLKANELLRAGIRDENEYYQRLEYFMGDIQNDIYLVEGKDTLPCMMNHYERNYGLAPYNNFVLAFGKSKDAKADKIFVYDDKILGTGKVMLKVGSSDIHAAPDINWN